MEQEAKKKTSLWQKVLYVVGGIVILIFLVSGNSSTLSEQEKEGIRQTAYNDVLEELETNGYPTGMLGVTYYMTQQEIRELFDNVEQFDSDILARQTTLYGRSIQASYHFSDGRLMQIVVSFKEQFDSLDEMSAVFYQTQEKLDSNYGQMSVTLNEIIPPQGDQWEDQQVLVAKKKLGRTSIIHQVSVQDNGIGEQLMMYLSSAE